MRWWMFAGLVMLGCTPQVPVEPPQPPSTHIIFLANPAECTDIVQLPSLQPSLTPVAFTPTKPSKGKPQRARSPLEVVTQAQKAARVAPTAEGFFGSSGEYTYVWQPGKTFDIYLTLDHPTLVFLPPGERLVMGLYLDKNLFTVVNKRVGQDALPYDAISIVPILPEGERVYPFKETDTFLLSESGRRYLLHLIVGAVGMQAVTWETPGITPLAQPQ